MKALRLAAVAIALAFASVPARAAVIMSYSGTTYLDCTVDESVCFANAQVNFELPTFDYLGPSWSPLAGAPEPPRYTYRVVITTSGPASETASKSYYQSRWSNFIYENGEFKYLYGNEWGYPLSFDTCFIGNCEPDGYAQGNQSIFQFADGLVDFSIRIENPQEKQDALVMFGWAAGVSATAFLDRSQVGLPFTAQLFQFAAVPEPSTWAMMILGFGFCGVMLRRRMKSEARC